MTPPRKRLPPRQPSPKISAHGGAGGGPSGGAGGGGAAAGDDGDSGFEIADEAVAFASYDDYLDSHVTEKDMHYLEDEDLARQVIGSSLTPPTKHSLAKSGDERAQHAGTWLSPTAQLCPFDNANA